MILKQKFQARPNNSLYLYIKTDKTRIKLLPRIGPALLMLKTEGLELLPLAEEFREARIAETGPPAEQVLDRHVLLAVVGRRPVEAVLRLFHVVLAETVRVQWPFL